MQGQAVLRGIVGAAFLASSGCAIGPGHRGVATETVARTVSVYYATDREAVSRDPGNVAFGWRRGYGEEGRPFELGVCRIEISRQRNHDKVSPLPRYSSELVKIVSTSRLQQRRFYDRIRERMWYAGANETFVFVHGFNNTFETAAKRAAEIWYDVGFEGPPIMFSWPSRGGSFFRGVFGYFADSETMEWSAVHLKTFLLELVAETSAEKLYVDDPARVHLIAHSLGSHMLLRAILLVADELKQRDRPIFCDIILAAPDIDRDIFRDVIVLDLLRARLAEHYTLYASSADKVIKTSQTLQFYPRAGYADEGIVAVDHQDFDTIDASAIHSGRLALNHDYFVTEPRLIRDLIQVLRKQNRDPASPGRSMRRRAAGPAQPWVLLPDAETLANAGADGLQDKR